MTQGLVSLGMRQLGKITCYIAVPKGMRTEYAARLFLEGHREKTSNNILSCLADTTAFYIILHPTELTFLRIHFHMLQSCFACCC